MADMLDDSANSILAIPDGPLVKILTTHPTVAAGLHHTCHHLRYLALTDAVAELTFGSYGQSDEDLALQAHRLSLMTRSLLTLTMPLTLRNLKRLTVSALTLSDHAMERLYTSLQLPSLSNLEFFRMSDNKISATALLQFMERFPYDNLCKLRTLEIDELVSPRRSTEECFAKALAAGLCAITSTVSLEKLQVIGVQFAKTGTHEFAKGLQRVMSSLHTIDLTCSIIDDDSAIKLAGVIHQWTALRELILGSCEIHEDGAIAILRALRLSPCVGHVTRLDFSCECFEDGVVRALSSLLPHLKTLQHFHLWNSDSTIQDAASIFEAMHDCVNIETLDIGKIDIGYEGAVALAHLLPCVPNLRELNLHYSDIGGGDGGKLVAEALQHCVNIEEIHMCGCSFGSSGAHALATSLPLLKKVRVLGIMDNDIDKHGMCAVATAIRTSTHLTSLEKLRILDSTLDMEYQIVVVDAIRRGTHLTSLEALDVYIDNDVVTQEIAQALKCSTHLVALKELHLMGKGIDDQGARLVADALHHNKHLTSLTNLRMDCTNIGDVGMRCVADALKTLVKAHHRARTGQRHMQVFARVSSQMKTAFVAFVNALEDVGYNLMRHFKYM